MNVLASIFSRENIPYTIFWVVIAILVITIYVIVRLVIFQKSFVNGKLKILSRIDIDPESNHKVVTLSLINRTFNNIQLKAFGIQYLFHHYDYIGEYREVNNLKNDEKIFIAQRDSVVFQIDLDELRSKFSSSKIKKIKVYVIDVLGKYSKKKASFVRKYIIQELKLAEFSNKSGISEEKKQAKLEVLKAKTDKFEEKRLQQNAALEAKAEAKEKKEAEKKAKGDTKKDDFIKTDLQDVKVTKEETEVVKEWEPVVDEVTIDQIKPVFVGEEEKKEVIIDPSIDESIFAMEEELKKD